MPLVPLDEVAEPVHGLALARGVVRCVSSAPLGDAPLLFAAETLELDETSPDGFAASDTGGEY